MSGATSFPIGQGETLRRMAQADNYNGWLFDRSRPYLGGSVLEVGAGVGTFTESAAAVAERVVALEPDPAFVPALERRFAGRGNVDVVPLEIEAAALDAEFDSILCFNVLEHIDDDARALARFHAALRPSGHLLLLVPAHPLLFGATDVTVAHKRRYRRPELDRLLREAAFDVVALRHVNPVGAAGWLVSSRILRREQVPNGPLRAFDRAVPLLRLLDGLQLPFGLSLWAVARRRDQQPARTGCG